MRSLHAQPPKPSLKALSTVLIQNDRKHFVWHAPGREGCWLTVTYRSADLVHPSLPEEEYPAIDTSSPFEMLTSQSANRSPAIFSH